MCTCQNQGHGCSPPPILLGCIYNRDDVLGQCTRYVTFKNRGDAGRGRKSPWVQNIV